jgi:hypothetical protein
VGIGVGSGSECHVDHWQLAVAGLPLCC